jgi:hypothetical protein
MEKEKKKEDTYDILLSRDDSEDYNVNTFVKEKKYVSDSGAVTCRS